MSLAPVFPCTLYNPCFLLRVFFEVAVVQFAVMLVINIPEQAPVMNLSDIIILFVNTAYHKW